MKPVYTIEDFKTRAGRQAFELCHDLTDYDLFNRFEPKDPTSAKDEFTSLQDKEALHPHMSRYQATLQKPEGIILLPSGGIVTPDEVARLTETMVRKSYMDAHHDFEEVLSKYKDARDIYAIFTGQKPLPGIQRFVAAVAICPAEASFVRLELNNPVLAQDNEIYGRARSMTETLLGRTKFTAPDGSSVDIPLIGPSQGPRHPNLTDGQMQALANIWVMMDLAQPTIQRMYMDKYGVPPGVKPS